VRALSLHRLGQPEAAAANLVSAKAAVPDLEQSLASSTLYSGPVKQTLLAGIAEVDETQFEPPVRLASS
jgi:hypothetical protein